jgi:hypothetical protein
MSNTKVKDAFKSLTSSVYSNEEWASIVMELLLGQMFINILNLIDKYRYPKIKNPRMYWELGRELSYFIERRKQDSKKFNNKSISKKFLIDHLTTLLSEIKNPQFSNIDDHDEDKKGSRNIFSSKRTLEAVENLFFLSDQDEINPSIPWSIYQEYAAQRAKLKNLTKLQRKAMITALNEFRLTNGTQVSDRVVRKGLTDYFKRKERKIYKSEVLKSLKNALNELTKGKKS